MTPDGFSEFEFDLPDALLTHLVEALDHMEGAPLLPINVHEIPEAQGVYQLSLKGEIVYIGKTDAEAGLRARLERHAWTIQHRRNLGPEEVTFKALRVFVFTAVDLETQLIRHYRSFNPVAWNDSGFGSNDPGRERDTTNVKPEGFDSLYPIDFDRILEFTFSQTAPASAVLLALRSALPYTFRVETATRGSRRLHPELEVAVVKPPTPPLTVRTILNSIVSQLPKGWQATGLAGRIIMYKESRDYPFGEVIARS